jgi:hypothetical protein
MKRVLLVVLGFVIFLTIGLGVYAQEVEPIGKKEFLVSFRHFVEPIWIFQSGRRFKRRFNQKRNG